MRQENRERICLASCSGEPMSGLESESVAFVQALLSGMIVYSGYFCIRKFRRVVAHKLFAIAIEDILFWIATSIYLFVQIYYTSDGSIRWHFVLGVVIGAGILFVIQRCIEKIHKKDKNRGKY